MPYSKKMLSLSRVILRLELLQIKPNNFPTMKKLLLIAYALISTSAMAQNENYLNQPVNQDGDLRYSFTVVNKDSKRAKEMGYNIALAALDTKLKLNYEAELDTTLVDLVFHLTDNEIYTKGYTKSQNSTESAVQAALEIVETKLYSGTPPTYYTVFSAKDGLYDNYRIPSAVALPSGRILTVIEARSSGHDQAENDLVARYSDDKGRSWSDVIVIDQQGEASLNNPCMAYIPETKQVMVIYQNFPPKMTEGNALEGKKEGSIVRTFITFSDDEGVSWSSPRDITSEVKFDEAGSYCSGPGGAIVVKSGKSAGRIVAPFNVNGGTEWYNYLVYSDDCGKSWKISNTVSGYGTNESQVVELEDGRLMVNARSHRFVGEDGKESPEGWNPWNFNRVTRNRAQIYVTMSGDDFEWSDTEVREDEPDPTCQGSVIRVSGLGDGRESRILISNAANQRTGNAPLRLYASTPPARINGEVKLSYDETKSWEYRKRIYGNRFTEFQYSVLVDMGDGMVGCFFEASPNVQFAVFDLEWLSEGTDTKF